MMCQHHCAQRRLPQSISVLLPDQEANSQEFGDHCCGQMLSQLCKEHFLPKPHLAVICPPINYEGGASLNMDILSNGNESVVSFLCHFFFLHRLSY